MQVPDINKISIDNINDELLQMKKVELDVLRLDKIHPVISGNKWFKLKFHIGNFNAGNYKGILTFGGAWSNHLVATACACSLQSIKSIGVIRGEKPPQLSAALIEAVKYGMELKFIRRESYRERNTKEFLDAIRNEFAGYYIMPEGGAGNEGERGAAEILQLIPGNYYTHIACAVGTGTMLRGISNPVSANMEFIGVVVLKGWREQVGTSRLFTNYHFGGYAKYNQTLIDFINKFYHLTGIPTDFVYTGKLAYTLFDLADKGYFPPGSRVLMIHSGGLQGNASLQKGMLIF